MVNYKRYKPVLPLTLKGKMLVFMLRNLFRMRKITGRTQWKTILKDHHEDPLKMTQLEKIYLGYKYYYKAITTTDVPVEHFKNQNLDTSLPKGFIEENKITLSAGGDLMAYDCVNTKTCRDLWNDTGDFFFGSDLVFANLETPVDLTKKPSLVPEVMLSHMYFNINEDAFNVFNGLNRYKSYDVLSVANNHSLDMGVDGLLATLDFLDRKKIPYAGAARSEADWNNFPIIEKKGIKTAFISYTFSLNLEQVPADKKWLCNHINLNESNPDISIIVQQAHAARMQGADVVVAALHMGCAYQPYPSQQTVDTIHRICREAGIDIVLGGHPHNPQPLEIYSYPDPVSGAIKKSFIVYSLGDFVAYDIFKWCHLPFMLRLEISKGTLDGKPYTQVSNIKLKPVYLHAEMKNGKINSLRFVDFYKAIHEPGKYFNDRRSLKEIAELRDFLERFIVSEKQKSVLAEKPGN